VTKEAQDSVAIPEQIQLAIRLESIFMPYATRQRRTFLGISGDSSRFAHYTSAEAAVRIINSKRIWLRNTTCMSDYREVQHGFEILSNFFRDEAKRKVFIEALDERVPGAALEALKLFDQWWSDIQVSTYIASTSEHDDSEDLHGRLSMWRAFGGSAARVAMVFKVPGISGGAAALNLMFSPVAYLTEAQAHDELHTVIENIRTNGEYLRSLDRSVVVGIVFNTLVAAVACLKHEGFREEREWRVIYAPKRSPSALMESSTEVVEGVPQIVYKAPLDATVSDALSDLELARMFYRLIIGPSPYPWVMYEAFVAALGQAGVANAGSRVFVSNIPIRG